MSCGGNSVTGTDGGHVALADTPCCGCMTLTASLSGSFQKSNACDDCFGHDSVCQFNVSSSVDSLASTKTCCGGAPLDDCAGFIYGGPCCGFANDTAHPSGCNFVGGPGFTGFRCGNVTCQAYTAVGRIICEDPKPATMNYARSACFGGTFPCGFQDCVCVGDNDCPEYQCGCNGGYCCGAPLLGTCTEDADCPSTQLGCPCGVGPGADKCSIGPTCDEDGPNCIGGECYNPCPSCTGVGGGCDTAWLEANDGDFFYNGFEIAGCVHHVSDDNWLDLGFPPGYYISFWPYLQFGCVNLFLSAHDFESGMVFYLGASPPTGTQTFDWTDCDMMEDPNCCGSGPCGGGGGESCGLEGISYHVEATFTTS